MLLLLILIVFILVIGLPIALTVYLYNKLRKTKVRKYAFLVPTIIIGFIIFEIYVAFFPLDSFYKEDFTSETKIDFPASGDILSKYATYPDQHGHYTSVALVELSSADYNSLLNRINNDITFKEDASLGENDYYEEVTGNVKPGEMKKIVRKGKMIIGFINDNKRIVLERHLSG